MSARGTSLFVGMGSPFGDDRLGWVVADELERRDRGKYVVRKANSPADLFDWLTGVDRLIVCDACVSHQPRGTVLRFPWPDAELATLGFSGTHDLNLPAALELASTLAVLPTHTTIWSLTIAERWNKHPAYLATSEELGNPDRLSRELRFAIPLLLDQIEQELLHA